MGRFLSALLCTTLAGLVYVYTEVEAVKIGYTIRKQEEIKTQFLDHSRSLQYNIARLKSPQTLEKKLVAERIELESPRAWQTLVVTPSGKPTNRAQALDLGPKPMLGRFFIATAQAEAKENR